LEMMVAAARASETLAFMVVGVERSGREEPQPETAEARMMASRRSNRMRSSQRVAGQEQEALNT
jgi:hypothetical protein